MSTSDFSMDERYNMRWGNVTVFYYIAPYLDKIFRLTTCIERTRAGKVHNEIGMVTVAKTLLRLRNIQFPTGAITPHTIYRTALPASVIKKINEDSDDSSDSSSSSSSSDDSSKDSDSESDSESDDDKDKPWLKYNVMAGPELFDTRTEALVLFPNLIGTVSNSNPIISTGAMGEAVSNAIAAGNGAKRNDSDPADSDADDDGEPATIFEHKLYDEGEYIKELEKKLRAVLETLSDESEGKDPNAAIFKRIICECFLPWAVPGFKRRPCGILLHGPPGNGKSYMVDAYIRERLGMEMTGLNYASSRFSGGKVGEGERKMRKEAAKCFEDRTRLYCMFIDEIDTVGGDRNRKENEGYKTDYLNQLLAIIGQRNYQNLFVIGATNYKDKLDAALVRDGRLENHYYLPSMDKNRRLDHLSRKLAGALTSLTSNSVRVTTEDVRRCLDQNKPILGYLVRNTINFTFAQFDRLCSDIEGYLRIHFWSHTMNTVSVLADWLPHIAERGFQFNGAGQLVLLAKDQMINSCLEGTVKMAVDNYFKGNSMENLAYNRVALDSSSSNDATFAYSQEVREFFVRESRFHSAVAPPTGRFIINIGSKSKFPEFLVELAKNPVLAAHEMFAERRIVCRSLFFNDSVMSKMIQPLVTARAYEFIQIIDRETIQLAEEDKLYDTLKGKYQEAQTLAENGTAGLIIIRLNDLVGHILKVLTTSSATKTTRESKELWTYKERTLDQRRTLRDTDQERLINERQIKAAMEIVMQQTLLMLNDNLESLESKLEMSNQIVTTKSENATEEERLTQAQEQATKAVGKKSEKIAEFSNVLERLTLREQEQAIHRDSKSETMENRQTGSLLHAVTVERVDALKFESKNEHNLNRDNSTNMSTALNQSVDNSTSSNSNVSSGASNARRNVTDASTHSNVDTTNQLGNDAHGKTENTQSQQNNRSDQNQNTQQASNQNQLQNQVQLTDQTQDTGQRTQTNSDNTQNTQLNSNAQAFQTDNQDSNSQSNQTNNGHQDQNYWNQNNGTINKTSNSDINLQVNQLNHSDLKTDNTFTVQDSGNKMKFQQTYDHKDYADQLTGSQSQGNMFDDVTNHQYRTFDVFVNQSGRQNSFKPSDQEQATKNAAGTGDGLGHWTEHNTTGSAVTPGGLNIGNGGGSFDPNNLGGLPFTASGAGAPLSITPGSGFGSSGGYADATGKGFTDALQNGGNGDNTRSAQIDNYTHNVTNSAKGNTGLDDHVVTTTGTSSNGNQAVTDGHNNALNHNFGSGIQDDTTTDTGARGDSHNNSNGTQDSSNNSTTGNTTTSNTNTDQHTGQTQQSQTGATQNTQAENHADQQSNSNTGNDTHNESTANTNTTAAQQSDMNQRQGTTDGFRSLQDDSGFNNKTSEALNLSSNIDNNASDSQSNTRTVNNNITDSVTQTLKVSMSDVASTSESRTHTEMISQKATLQDQSAHSLTENVSNTDEVLRNEHRDLELSHENRQQGEMTHQIQKDAEEIVRLTMNMEAKKLLEMGLNEEYRQTQAKTLTNRQELRERMKEDQTDETKNTQTYTYTNDLEKTLADIKETIDKMWDKAVDEIRSSVSSESRSETAYSDDVLRPKILDVVGRFAGITSKYLNAFDAQKGPDILFVVENEGLLDMLKIAIQWGDLKPSRPRKSMSIPDTFLTPYYDAALEEFWADTFAEGSLTNMKIVLAANDKDKSTGLKPFDTVPSFLEKPAYGRNPVADGVKSVEIEGSFVITDSTFYKKHATFLNGFANLTILRLINMGLSASVFQGFQRSSTEQIGLVCPNLTELVVQGCRLPTRSINQNTTGDKVLIYDPESLLCYLTGAKGIEDPRIPKITKLSVAYPVPSPLNKGRKHIWNFIGTPSFVFLKTLRHLDLSKHLITWTALEAAMAEIGKNLHTLILDGCAVADFNFTLKRINEFIETQLPQALRGLVRRPATRAKGDAPGESGADNAEDYYINGHNVKPDAIYFLLVYWSESQREKISPRALTFAGY